MSCQSLLREVLLVPKVSNELKKPMFAYSTHQSAATLKEVKLQVQMTSPDDPRFSDDEHSSSNLRFAISMCCQLLNGTTSHANYTLLNIYKTAAPRLALANKLTMGREPVWSCIWIFKPLTFSRCILYFHSIKDNFCNCKTKKFKIWFHRFYYPIVTP